VETSSLKISCQRRIFQRVIRDYGAKRRVRLCWWACTSRY